MSSSPVGKPTSRVDGPLKVTGAARYAADQSASPNIEKSRVWEFQS